MEMPGRIMAGERCNRSVMDGILQGILDITLYFEYIRTARVTVPDGIIF